MNQMAPSPVRRAIRVLVVDDSAVVRGLISRHLSEDPDIEVVGTAPNGKVALDELGRRPADVVVLDVEMPVMDGLTALPEIRRAHPATRVLMASSLTRRNAEISLRALQIGASDYLAKPEGSLSSAVDFKRELILKVKSLGGRRLRTPVETSATEPTPAPPMRSAPWRQADRAPEVLAIGSSTGGPAALLQLFTSLKGRIAQPILIVQHMPPTFTAVLAERIAREGERPCSEATDGEPVTPGRTYIAPGGWHMRVEKTRRGAAIRLDQTPPVNFCRPAVDPLFASVAEVYGPAALALVLTGMGADGARGCVDISRAGGRFAVQDEESSVVWGMPGAAFATGLADSALPLHNIADWLQLKMKTIA